MSPQRPAASKSAKSLARSPDPRPSCPWLARPICAHGARVPPKAGPIGVQRPASRVAVQARSWKLVHVCPGLCLGDWPARHSNGVAVFLDQFYLVEPLIWNQRGQNQLSVGGKLHVEPVPRLGWRQEHPPFSIGCDCHKGSIPPEACDSKTFWPAIHLIGGVVSLRSRASSHY